MPKMKLPVVPKDVWVNCDKCGEAFSAPEPPPADESFEWRCPKCGTYLLVERVLYWVSREI